MHPARATAEETVHPARAKAEVTVHTRAAQCTTRTALVSLICGRRLIRGRRLLHSRRPDLRQAA